MVLLCAKKLTICLSKTATNSLCPDFNRQIILDKSIVAFYLCTAFFGKAL
jgi:hypothetical protein